MNYNVPSEIRVNEFVNESSPHPGFKCGVSIPTMKYMLNKFQGAFRMGADATDVKAEAGYVKDKFEPGDVFFPGSNYDKAKLEDEYGEIVRPLIPFIECPDRLNPKTATSRDIHEFDTGIKHAADHLQKHLDAMKGRITVLTEDIARRKDIYIKRQAQKVNKVLGKGKAGEDVAAEADEDPQDEQDLHANQVRAATQPHDLQHVIAAQVTSHQQLCQNL